MNKGTKKGFLMLAMSLASAHSSIPSMALRTAFSSWNEPAHHFYNSKNGKNKHGLPARKKKGRGGRK